MNKTAGDLTFLSKYLVWKFVFASYEHNWWINWESKEIVCITIDSIFYLPQVGIKQKILMCKLTVYL